MENSFLQNLTIAQLTNKFCISNSPQCHSLSSLQEPISLIWPESNASSLRRLILYLKIHFDTIVLFCEIVCCLQAFTPTFFMKLLSFIHASCIMSDYRFGRPGFDPQQRQRIFLLVSACRPVLGPTQPAVQWVMGPLTPGVKRGRDVMLTTHSLLMPIFRKSWSYTASHRKRLHGV
jgi:hypothetical protein